LQVTSVVQKIVLAIIPDQAYNSYKLEATPALTHGQAAVWGAVNSLSDRFYTPTLIHVDNEREGWVMSHKLSWLAALLANAQACLPACIYSLADRNSDR
jgi:hypothetical protein